MARQQATRLEPDTGERDLDLLTRMAAGDQGALDALYTRHGGTAYALARAILGESADAEEVVVDAYAQLWRTAGQFDPSRGSVLAWLTTITRSRALDLLRCRRRRDSALDRMVVLAPPEAAMAAENSAEREEAHALVRRSLGTLPEPQRRAIELAYFRGLSHSEIAAELNEPLGTVKTRIRAGLERLRAQLAPLLSEVQS